jgi:DNA-directed RNA polymerase specialized sigma24 family protein
VVQQYGDLLFDLCESILWSPTNAQLAFRAILREIKSTQEKNKYTEYERPWVLRIASKKLLEIANKHGRRLTPSEQIMLDATLKFDARIKQFDSYFHRLSAEDQLLLLLRDKFGLSYQEIASATGIPEGSIKMRRQQSLRTIEEWLWENQ